VLRLNALETVTQGAPFVPLVVFKMWTIAILALTMRTDAPVTFDTPKRPILVQSEGLAD
jgi:hypothetical protein